MSRENYGYGRSNYFVELANGDVATFTADNVIVTAVGALVVTGQYQRYGEGPNGEPSGPVNPDRPAEVTIAYAPGEWKQLYSCSVLTGDPVALVDYRDAE